MESLQKMGEATNIISVFCRLNARYKMNLPIRISELGMLMFIVLNEETATPATIADIMKVKKPMVSDMIATLYQEGYLLKVPSKVDKRSYNLEPTDKAKLLVDRTYHEYTNDLRFLTKEMGETDFNQLIHLLKIANDILLEERDK